VRTNRWPFWTAWGLAIGLMLVLACVEKARRVYPMNMLLLGAFTVAQAFLVGMISAYYNIEVRRSLSMCWCGCLHQGQEKYNELPVRIW
jgi:FtsH-binding integral membrane protein